MDSGGKVTNADLFGAAIKGSKELKSLALRKLEQFTDPQQIVEYPETCYELPTIYAWLGKSSKTIGDLQNILVDLPSPSDEPNIENALCAGELAMISAEIIEALKYVEDSDPYAESGYCGFIPDKTLREFGVAFVDDTIPGAAVLTGKAPDADELVKIVRDLQSKGIITFAAGEIADQLRDKNIQMGSKLLLFPIGSGTQTIHAVNFAIRAALSFGAIARGERTELSDYLSKRPKVFVISFGPIDEITAALAMAAIINKAVVVSDQDVEEIPNVLASSKSLKVVQTAIELREIIINLASVDIPVAYGPAFEGESIRKPDTYLEAGGSTKTTVFELLRMCSEDEVEDGRIKLIGKDVDEFEDGSATPLAILVDVYGKKMQADFESVLERRIHLCLNFAQGVWHTGQRNMIWVRLSKTAVASGMRLKHFGDILIAKLKEEFSSIISRVQVTIITDESEIARLLPLALDRYAARDARLAGLTDESVDRFYTCGLCSSFAPGHVCIIMPERLGLCGAINWLDAKAAQEIDPHGPNQTVLKGECFDLEKGQWAGVNDAIYEGSNHKIEHVNTYSMMEDPMTSCGCFEVIVGMTSDMQAVFAVSREYGGMTPVGMKFSTLAGSVGGGKQTPGFMGIGRKYLTSKKFIPADGGFLRIAWMPKDLKETIKEQIQQRAVELGVPDFFEKIADETITTDAEGLIEWMTSVNHPALSMPPLLQ
ncbi:acetyl-CoA decarbonylase/synthase complex subunit alpha/beta [Candidatus Methanomassiliicoccus intestinalis]|uniref:acetyl-CoA decarbonylase/synthase complex subunit alpha/beta n=1 Tax=Candidatus Methanomassiliicoccus intestinalis TaxID=1406512 RepID=UPI0037DDC38D